MVPPTTHQSWQGLVTGKVTFRPSTLAAKILMQRIDQRVKADPSSTSVGRCVNELYAFFLKYEQIERADLAQIFGQENRQ